MKNRKYLKIADNDILKNIPLHLKAMQYLIIKP